MFVTDLAAVNAVLRELGEQPVVSLDAQLPTLDIVRPALESARLDLLGQQWWFNTYTNFRISPDEDKRIEVPADTLVFTPKDRELRWSGRYVRKADGSLTFDAPVVGTRVADLPFLELPYYATQFVIYTAAAQVYSQDFGVDSKYNEIATKARTALQLLGMEHTRAVRGSIRDRPAIRRYYMDLHS